MARRRHAVSGERSRRRGARVIDEARKLIEKAHRWLLDAFDKRIQGDYGIDVTLTREDAVVTIAQAREFLAAARRHLQVGESPS